MPRRKADGPSLPMRLLVASEAVMMYKEKVNTRILSDTSQTSAMAAARAR